MSNSVVHAINKFIKIAIFEYCEINECDFHTRTINLEEFEKEFGVWDTYAPVMPNGLTARVLNEKY